MEGCISPGEGVGTQQKPVRYGGATCYFMVATPYTAKHTKVSVLFCTKLLIHITLSVSEPELGRKKGYGEPDSGDVHEKFRKPLREIAVPK